jgi:hypothetical protein
MVRRRKTFPCGHKGFGQECHRCAEERALQEQKRQQKQQWEATFAEDPIDLTNLPPHVVLKARSIIAGLQSQQNYTVFGGKRLRHNRLIVSIPINRDYRMICRDWGSNVVPQTVLSHEEYNVKKPGG